MTAILAPNTSTDEIAESLSRAMATANLRANEIGIDLKESSILAERQMSQGRTVWEISYGSKDYVNQRGGDTIFVVDYETGNILKQLRGQ